MSDTPSLLNIDPTSTLAWNKLNEIANTTPQSSLKQKFSDDPDRVNKYSMCWRDLYLDYSKNLINDEVLNLLLALASELNLADGIQKMFSGNQINETERRSVLHVALRMPKTAQLILEGKDVIPEVQQVLERMRQFTTKLNAGDLRGYRGNVIKDVVNIGIGGSDLGPMMVSQALKMYAFPGRKIHFVSNVDGSDINQTLEHLDPSTTMFIIASKTFTTIETMTNAKTAKAWFLSQAPETEISKHFVAISTNAEGVSKFGIDLDKMFGFWNWVGGRFSLSSAIGLSIMIATSPEHFDDLLAGMHAMDEHFRTASFNENIPVLLALVGIWYINFLHAETHAILPYDQNLEHLPSYLQQASMESNGKSTSRTGARVAYQTGAIIWGGAGTNSQHSFFQLLHQGTRLIPCDFILPVNPAHELSDHHDLLVANALAQTEALLRGKSEQEVREELADQGLNKEHINFLAPFKIFEGNNPSNLIMIKELTPFNLGALIAMYEHKIFVQGYIWNIFSFDQFGVELGKALAKAIQPELRGSINADLHDPSTIAALQKFHDWKVYQ